MTGKIISIEGLIGAGKTTLAEAIKEKYNYHILYEPVESNPYLEDFYGDQVRWAFPMQVHLLRQRHNMMTQAMTLALDGKNVVTDRSLYGDICFVEVSRRIGVITKQEYQTYLDLYEIYQNISIHPDLIFFLNVDPELALKRIKLRSRACEIGIPLNYLQQLDEAYYKFLVSPTTRIKRKNSTLINVAWDWENEKNGNMATEEFLKEFRNNLE